MNDVSLNAGLDMATSGRIHHIRIRKYKKGMDDRSIFYVDKPTGGHLQ